VSRAAFVGASYGALHGEAAAEVDGSEGGVPLSWLCLLHDGASILQAAREVVDLRGNIAQRATVHSQECFLGA